MEEFLHKSHTSMSVVETTPKIEFISHSSMNFVDGTNKNKHELVDVDNLRRIYKRRMTDKRGNGSGPFPDASVFHYYRHK